MTLWQISLGIGETLVKEQKYNAKLKDLINNFGIFSDYEILFLNWAYESLVFATETKFDFIEMIIESPLNARPVVTDQFIKLCQEFPIAKTVHAPFMQANIVSLDHFVKRASIAENLNACEIARRIGAKKVTIHPGAPKPKLQFLDTYYPQSFAESMAEIGDHYHDNYRNDFVLCVENMPKSEAIFGKVAEIRAAFDDPALRYYKMTIDTSHGWTVGGDDHLNTMIDTMKDKISHVHAVDNNTFDNDPHIPVGTGKIDFNRCIQSLKRIGFDDTVTIEMPGRKNTLTSREKIQDLLK